MDPLQKTLVKLAETQRKQARYWLELQNLTMLNEHHPQFRPGHREAMTVTLNNVIIPMLTTTLAAIILMIDTMNMKNIYINLMNRFEVKT